MNVVDMVSHYFGGDSLTMSVSGDFQMSSAFAAHQMTVLENPTWQNSASFYNVNSEEFSSVYPSKEKTLAVTYSNAMSRLKARNIPGVSFEGLPYYTFADFFLELEAFFSMIDQIKASPKSKDSIPDLYFMTFSSIEKIVASFGMGSNSAQMVFKIFNSCLTFALEELDAVYNGRFSAQLLCLGEAPADQIKKTNLEHVVFEKQLNHLGSRHQFNVYFPTIYIENKDQVHQICNELKQSLRNYVNVACPDKEAIKRQVTTSPPTTAAPTTSPSTDDEGEIVQITLWISIVMVAFLLLAYYSMIYMDQDYDSKIWRQETKPVHKNQ